MMEEQLAVLEQATTTPREIAMLRIRYISDEGSGFAATFVPYLKDAIDAWFDCLSTCKESALLVADARETQLLKRILQIHLNCTTFDPTLDEELGRQGSHVQLLKLIQYDVSTSSQCEADQDAIMELQDIACEIAAHDNIFPRKVSPISPEELRQRLPLIFNVDPVEQVFINGGQDRLSQNTETVLIHQVTSRQSAQDDVGYVMWPSAVVLARYLVTHSSSVRGKRVLELGAGCGLVGVTAARLQKYRDTKSTSNEASIILTDFNKTVLQNLDRNVALNHVSNVCSVVGLDFYQQTGNMTDKWKDMTGTMQKQVDVVLAADMICQPQDAVASANALHDALRPGGRGYIVCADAAHRFGVGQFASECHRVGLNVTVHNVRELYDGQLLTAMDLEKTAGYVDGMNLLMFFVEKPSQ